METFFIILGKMAMNLGEVSFLVCVGRESQLFNLSTLLEFVILHFWLVSLNI